jgi:ribosomal 50S subunit-recycling heat shock protein
VAGRIDKALAQSSGLSRERVKALLDEGRVDVDGKAVRQASLKVEAGATFTVRVPAAAPAEAVAQDIPLRVTYEDDALIVIDKPAGMVVHPAAGNPDGTLVNALLHHCRGQLSGIGGVARPGIVHRIDKDTSGLLVVAKTDAAHEGSPASSPTIRSSGPTRRSPPGIRCLRRARFAGRSPARTMIARRWRWSRTGGASTRSRITARSGRFRGLRWSSAGSKRGEPTRCAFTLHQ